MVNHQLSNENNQYFYGLTLFIIIDMEFMSSGSAVAGFPCSKPPLNPIIKASSIKWRLSYIEKTILNQ
ncbi:hypothetical protein D1AOALGA4SA_1449 [Olavius algarvensis Delta 1 endosymbiont]|nr:hypothetical protein D1AOALGA4SA_1449 [Olavius algarvensis Delta 1 endosymbiont]